MSNHRYDEVELDEAQRDGVSEDDDTVLAPAPSVTESDEPTSTDAPSQQPSVITWPTPDHGLPMRLYRVTTPGELDGVGRANDEAEAIGLYLRQLPGARKTRQCKVSPEE